MSFGLLGNDEPGLVRTKGPTLGNKISALPALDLPAVASIKPTREEVMAAYNRVYGLMPSTIENHAVGKRLADLHMDIGQDLDIEGGVDPYRPAVDLYEKLLLEAGEGDQVDAILYQLARAHDLAGEQTQTLSYLDRLVAEHPDSEFIAEGRFRRAEIKFSAEDYRAAADDYAYVVSLGEQSPYLQNASYMLGWSEFKRSRFDEGLHQFFNVVDTLLVDGDAASLSAINTEFLEDSFRVITLGLSYLDGAKTLADEMRKRDHPEWQYLAYQRLADDYFVKERFLDNVATWQTFIEHNSLDRRAPAAHTGMIKTLMDAGFPSDVLPKKKEFILRYGVYSEFWTYHTEEVRSEYLPTLHGYLSEIAKLTHADAQAFDVAQQNAKRPAKGSTEQRIALYLEATAWYEEIITTFPEDPRTAEYLFLLGESYTEAAEPGRAVAAYQRVVRDFPDYPDAHEAGYAAILGLTELVSTAGGDELELWQRLKIDAQIEFALIFPGDMRAPAVQTDAADTLFTLGHTSEALDLAENLLLEWPDVAPELRKTALLIIGHGRYELDQFVPAEAAYHQLLAVELSTDERTKVAERLLAAVYKQGEASESAGDVDTAVYHFMRLAQISPGAALAAQGHFDAIAVVESAGRVSEAVSMLAEFRSLYPQHELGKGIDMRLAGMYEQTQDWSAAAVEYAGLAKTADDVEVRRQSLYRAAEIYLQQDNVNAAIESFRDYAHTYKKPWDLRLEAIHNMDELYQRVGDIEKQRFWMDQKIKLHREMGSQATERATYLAASAQMVFAADARYAYQSIRLTHPLNRSLKQKQKALKQTLKAYEQVTDYEVEAFTTASTFEIADLYTALSKSIMTSDRPKDLSALELDQYEILLEEQAFPFEEQAIDLHQINMRRAWAGTYDDGVKKSFTELMRLMPGRFNKQESEVSYATAIH